MHHNFKTYPTTNISRYFFVAMRLLQEVEVGYTFGKASRNPRFNFLTLRSAKFSLQHALAQHLMEPAYKIFL